MTDKAKSLARFAGVSLLSLTILQAQAYAQTTPATTPTTLAGTGPIAPTGGVEDIIVTARKRQENLQNVPAAVSAISAAQIQRYDLSNLEKVAATVPDFSITRASNGSGAQLVLRGIGSSFTSIGIEQSVATVVDGVYYGQGRVINEGFFDLARIEILKGPQSLFFGKNSTAGVVSLTTLDPGDKTEVIARAGYEFKAEQVIGELIVSTPLSDTLGVRVALRGTKMFGGYFENDAGTINYHSTDVATGKTYNYPAPPAVRSGPQETEGLARITLKWHPTSEFTATIKASYNKDDNDNASYNYVIFDCPPGTNVLPSGTPCGRHFRNAQNNLPDVVAKSIGFSDNGTLFNKYTSYGVTANLNYAAEDYTIASITNYNHNKNLFQIDADYESDPATNIWATEQDNFHAFSTEQRLLTTFQGPVNVLAGVYYQHTRLHSFEPAVVDAGVEDSAAAPNYRYAAFAKDSGTVDNTIAGYGQVILKLVPNVELTGGARYTHETKDSFFGQPFVNPALAGVFIENEPFTLNQKFHNVSPEATATWRVTPDVTLYAAYKTGYKSGGFSNTAIQSAFGSQSNFAFNPEKARGVEGGIKTTLADRQVRLNLTGYHYKFSDLQVDFFNSTTISFITTNAGAATTDGAELEFEIAPRALAGFSTHGTLNYNKARYKDYIAPCYAGETPAEGCTLVASGVPSQDISGQPTASAPVWTASLGGTYEAALGHGLGFEVSVDARYSDHYIANGFANPDDNQPSYVNLDASARIYAHDKRVELALIGRNLTNRFVIDGSTDLVATGSGTGTAAGVHATQVGLISPPRTVQLQFTYHY